MTDSHFYLKFSPRNHKWQVKKTPTPSPRVTPDKSTVNEAFHGQRDSVEFAVDPLIHLSSAPLTPKLISLPSEVALLRPRVHFSSAQPALQSPHPSKSPSFAPVSGALSFEPTFQYESSELSASSSSNTSSSSSSSSSCSSSSEIEPSASSSSIDKSTSSSSIDNPTSSSIPSFSLSSSASASASASASTSTSISISTSTSTSSAVCASTSSSASASTSSSVSASTSTSTSSSSVGDLSGSTSVEIHPTPPKPPLAYRTTDAFIGKRDSTPNSSAKKINVNPSLNSTPKTPLTEKLQREGSKYSPPLFSLASPQDVPSKQKEITKRKETDDKERQPGKSKSKKGHTTASASSTPIKDREHGKLDKLNKTQGFQSIPAWVKVVACFLLLVLALSFLFNLSPLHTSSSSSATTSSSPILPASTANKWANPA